MDIENRCVECGSELDPKNESCPKCSTIAINQSQVETIAPSTISEDIPQKQCQEGSSLSSRYSVLREHGRGGMGRVLLVRDESLDRELVMKSLCKIVGKKTIIIRKVFAAHLRHFPTRKIEGESIHDGKVKIFRERYEEVVF